MLVGFGIIMTFLVCDNCWYELDTALKVIAISSTTWIVMWKGNSFVSDYWSNRLRWIDNPVKMMILVASSSAVFTASAMVGLLYGYGYVLDFDPSSMIKDNVITGLIITFFVSTFMHGRSFLFSWRDAALNEEKLRNESISSKYESLKNQVNPHFLFNSLNALTNLVHQDQDLAVKFIKQLSNVYRYVLDTKDKEVVDLYTELEFVQSYVFLQKIRFGENLQVKINLPGESSVRIPPLSLQMLIENAIKHNVISKEEPLNVELSMEDNNYIVIENNLQRKTRLKEKSSHVGLANIKARYEVLTDRLVEIIATDTKFIVKLPVLSKA